MSVFLVGVQFLSRVGYTVSSAVRQCCCDHKPESGLGSPLRLPFLVAAKPDCSWRNRSSLKAALMFKWVSWVIKLFPEVWAPGTCTPWEVFDPGKQRCRVLANLHPGEFVFVKSHSYKCWYKVVKFDFDVRATFCTVPGSSCYSCLNVIMKRQTCQQSWWASQRTLHFFP